MTLFSVTCGECDRWKAKARPSVARRIAQQCAATYQKPAILWKHLPRGEDEGFVVERAGTVSPEGVWS